MSILSFMQRWLQVQPASVPLARYDAPSGERIDDHDVLALSTAYACVRLLSGTGGALPAMVYRSPDGDEGVRLPAKDHWAYRLLHDSPNADQTAFEFFEEVWASLELKGNALAKKEVSSGGRVTSLIPMRWDETRISRSNGARRYEWRDEKLSADEVLHIRGFGGDDLGGLSTIAVGGSVFGLAKAVNKAAGAVFRNGIRTQIAFVAERDLQPEQMDAMAQRLEEKYQGSINSGRPLIMNNGLKPQTLQMNPEDAQMLESRGFSVEEVCRFFGVPPHMIGHTEKTSSWGTGVSEMTLAFLKYTLAPRMERIEQALMKQLLTAEDRARGVRIEFNVEGLLRADSKGRAEFYQKALGDTQKPGWMVRNEVRRLENLPPIPGWDDPVELFRQPPRDSAPGDIN